MAKLHELLAVNEDLKKQYNTARNGQSDTFKSKRHLFEGTKKTFTASAEGSEPVTEEEREVQSTVRSELKWFSDLVAPAFNTAHQIAEANTKARADIVLDDGTVLVKDVPATALLELEKRTQELHDLALAIPTLDPAKGFKLDAEAGAGIYRARDRSQDRTSKEPRVQIPSSPLMGR